MKKKLVETYINNACKKKLEVMFGEGSTVKVENTFKSSQLRTDVVEIKVFFSDPQVSLDYWPENINWLVEESWEFVHGKGTKVIVNASYDII
jgi:hypothetical protein